MFSPGFAMVHANGKRPLEAFWRNPRIIKKVQTLRVGQERTVINGKADIYDRCLSGCDLRRRTRSL